MPEKISSTYKKKNIRTEYMASPCDKSSTLVGRSTTGGAPIRDAAFLHLSRCFSIRHIHETGKAAPGSCQKILAKGLTYTQIQRDNRALFSEDHNET